MPDEFPLPIEPSNTVSALSCPDAAAHAADVPADSDNWQRLYDNALLASAARTLVANPDIAAFGTDADVATGNPWLLPPDVFARISDPDYWAALCDTGTGTDNGQAYAEFVALRQQELTIRFTADLEAMVEPSRASLQSDS